MQIVCSSTLNYLPYIAPYLDSLERHSQLPVTLVTVGYKLRGHHLGIVTPLPITQEQNAGAPEDTESIQHGSFTLLSPGDNEVVMYTDGDLFMQRPLSPQELEFLETFPDDAVALSWNSGADETLMVEAARLQPKRPLSELVESFGELVNTAPCFNVGVLIARQKTWRAIYHQYMLNWERVGEYLAHRARQQWLICYTIAALGLDVHLLPYSFHAHGHYGIPDGVYRTNTGAFYKNDLVLLRHKL
jgi:hypothetical protein